MDWEYQKMLRNNYLTPPLPPSPLAKVRVWGFSYQIIRERHGGSLECISQPGQGAEFVINIPLIQDTST